MRPLEAKDVHTYYGTSHILFGISFYLDDGEVVGLLGRNGAGKTTTLRSIIGLTPPKSGSIKIQGEEIRGKPAYIIARKGVGFVPDDRCIFPDLKVWENLDLGYRYSKNESHRWSFDRVYSLFPVLSARKNQLGGSLSGGEQQMLTLARTLMGDPSILLLDEPVEGIAPIVVKLIGEQIQELKKEKLNILLSEQNVQFAMGICDRAYVIDKGVIRYEGSIIELTQNEELKRKHLTL